MSYWVRLVTPDREHNEIESMNMSISWNYSNLMLHLPCGWTRDWQGKTAKDMQLPIQLSMNALINNPERFRQYELKPEEHLGSIDVCLEILEDALVLFLKHPEGIITVD